MTNVPWGHLDRYLSGDDTALDGWLDMHPDAKAELEAVRMAIHDPTPDAPAFSGDTLWAGLSSRMESEAQRVATVVAARRSAVEWRKRMFEVAGIAAVALITAIAIRPHHTNSSAISGQLPLDGIPDSNVVASSNPVAGNPVAGSTTPSLVVPQPQPVATTPSGKTPAGTVTTKHAPSNSDREPALAMNDDSLAPPPLPPPSSYTGGSTGPSPDAPVGTIADDRPGAADTNWP